MIVANKDILNQIYGYGLTDDEIDRALISFPNIVNKFLTPGEEHILTLRLNNNYTLEKTGNELGITRERVRQIEMRAIHKLQSPKLYDLVFNNDLLKKIEQLREEKREIIFSIKKETERLKALLTWLELFPNIKVENNDLTIESLDLTTRTYYCLKRANINTIQDLLNKTPEEVQKIHNLGPKSYQEIINKMKTRGIKYE